MDGEIPENPAVRRWQLAETLRKLREECALTHDQVIEKLRQGPGTWSRPKLSRIENREQGVKPRELDQLLDVYGVADPALANWLRQLAGNSRRRGWLADVRKHLPPEFHQFLDWETALVARRQFSTLLIPGLLQTTEYARCLISGVNPELTGDEVEQRVMARMARQQILGRADPPQLHVILDAGVLERPVGGPTVMRRQLRHLADAADHAHVSIQVLPKSVGAGPALEGPFSILTLPDPVPDIGYTEGPSCTAYIEDRDEVRDYTLRFGILTQQALSQSESLELVREAAQSFG